MGSEPTEPNQAPLADALTYGWRDFLKRCDWQIYAQYVNARNAEAVHDGHCAE